MSFVKDQQADIIEQRRIVTQREVELLRRRDDDVALADRVLVEAADADAAIEGRNGLAERAKGSLQRSCNAERRLTGDDATSTARALRRGFRKNGGAALPCNGSHRRPSTRRLGRLFHRRVDLWQSPVSSLEI